MTDDDLSEMARQIEERRYRRGEVVIRQGEPRDALYLIFSGAAEVVRGERVAAQLGPGDVFGEGALLRGGRRRTTVIADENLETLVLPRPAVETTLARCTRLRERLSRLRPRLL